MGPLGILQTAYIKMSEPVPRIERTLKEYEEHSQV